MNIFKWLDRKQNGVRQHNSEVAGRILMDSGDANAVAMLYFCLLFVAGALGFLGVTIIKGVLEVLLK